jgi:hypothetical protein
LQTASSVLPELPFGNFLAIRPVSGLLGALALWLIIDQMLKIPNSSTLLHAAFEVFRHGTVARPILIRCGSERIDRDEEKIKKIKRLCAWHGACSTCWQRRLANRRHEINFFEGETKK